MMHQLRWVKLWQQVSDALAPVAGTFGLSYLHLNTGERYSFNGDETFYAASVIKVPIMCEVFRQAEYEGLNRQTGLRRRQRRVTSYRLHTS